MRNLLKTSIAALAAALLWTAPALAQNNQSSNQDSAAGNWSSWLGTYAGVFAGGARLASSDDAGIDGLTSQAKHSDWSFQGGALLGYNFPAGQLMLGIEGDFAFMGGKTSEYGSPLVYGAPGGLIHKVEADWMATVRARVGLPMGQIMPFLTAGIAFSDITMSHSFPTFPGAGRSRSEVATGWTAGGGVDILVSRNISFRIEAMRADFGSLDLKNNPDPASALVFDQKVQPTIDTVRGAVTFRF